MNGLHDVFDPAGPQALALYHLWQLMLGVCTAVFVLTMAALVIALRRAPRATESAAPDLDAHPRKAALLRRCVAWGLGGSSGLLLVLLFASFFTDRALSALPLQGAVHIDLVGHQYWWEASYEPHDPAQTFVTANELHVPVGRPVLMRLRSLDVIHSFWVPNLSGKKDLIPGREATIAWRADRPGVYRGQCAEYCGYQHAHMALVVVAEAPEDYARWSAAQRAPAAAPLTAQQRRGLELVEQRSCAMCHAIGGTQAQARRAPDLTHLASRASLGAGTVANTPRLLAEWIANPQQFKPGVDMPPFDAAPEDLGAIVAYLATLR
jgi:cytochrome c oxidase subunit 2